MRCNFVACWRYSGRRRRRAARRWNRRVSDRFVPRSRLCRSPWTCRCHARHRRHGAGRLFRQDRKAASQGAVLQDLDDYVRSQAGDSAAASWAAEGSRAELKSLAGLNRNRPGPKWRICRGLSASRVDVRAVKGKGTTCRMRPGDCHSLLLAWTAQLPPAAPRRALPSRVIPGRHSGLRHRHHPRARDRPRERSAAESRDGGAAARLPGNLEPRPPGEPGSSRA